jgi:sugar phosphate isomerase/epimerase
MNRRNFLRSTSLFAGLAGLPPARASLPAAETKFRISLAQWSLHKAIRSRLTTNLEFPRIAREQFGIEGLEFVNGLWEAPTQSYVRRLKSNMEKTGTKGVLIMCDGEGLMGHSDKAERMKAARNHYKWVDIAAELGCQSIRTNMYPDRQPATPAEIDAFLGHCAESFAKLCEYARPRNVSVIIENHGGVSSNPDVVARLMTKVNLPNFGTLPDFGNFPKQVDKYDAVRKLMSFAKGVSFKCYDFGADGNETSIDMHRMMKIVLEAGYNGWVGIEYEGSRLTEFEGIQAAKRFLERVA